MYVFSSVYGLNPITLIPHSPGNVPSFPVSVAAPHPEEDHWQNIMGSADMIFL
jgi:hypothetical protein